MPKNLHLAISTAFVIPIALIYGLYPNITLLKLFHIKVDSINLTSIFRAIMGLYLGTAAIWLTGIFKSKFWFTATITNIVFMGGLAFGRLLSFVFDGIPSMFFLAGFMLELILAFWGVKNLRKYQTTQIV